MFVLTYAHPVTSSFPSFQSRLAIFLLKKKKSRAGLSRERLQQHVLERTFAKTELTYLQKMKVIALISIYVGRPGGVTATRRQAV